MRGIRGNGETRKRGQRRQKRACGFFQPPTRIPPTLLLFYPSTLLLQTINPTSSMRGIRGNGETRKRGQRRQKRVWLFPTPYAKTANPSTLLPVYPSTSSKHIPRFEHARETGKRGNGETGKRGNEETGKRGNGETGSVQTEARVAFSNPLRENRQPFYSSTRLPFYFKQTHTPLRACMGNGETGKRGNGETGKRGNAVSADRSARGFFQPQTREMLNPSTLLPVYPSTSNNHIPRFEL
jgi:hypothetical protein